MKLPRLKTFAESLAGAVVRTYLARASAALLLLPLLLAPCGAQEQQPAAPQKAQAAPPEAGGSAAATTRPTPPPRSAITGRVVGESGEPVPDAAVTLQPRVFMRIGGGSLPNAASDEAGNFSFEGLDPGLYEIFAMLPGFVVETDSLTGRPLLGPYRPGDNVVVRMVKGGVVTGTVTDGQGQPVAALGVRAVRVRDLDGSTPPSPFPNTGEDRTDDRGVYRIYGLRPGLYVVYAGGYGSSGFMPFASSGDIATFYPSGTRDAAAEVPVRAGQEVSNLDIRMREDPARQVSGTVESPTGTLGEFGAGINLTYASTGMVTGTAFINANATQRSFWIEGVADGEYDLQATSTGRDGVTMASASQRVSVRGADVTGLRLALVPLASASGSLRFEPAAEAGRPAPEGCKAVRASQLPQETLVTAAPEVKTGATAARVFSRLAVPQSATPDAAGAFTVRSLEGGRHRLSVRLFDEALYVRSIQMPAPAAAPPRAGAPRPATTTAASASASREVFDLKSGQQLSGLLVRVAEGAVSFAGTVAPPEPPAGSTPEPPPPFSQLRVHLLPQERERAEDLLRYYEAPVTSEGTFSFKNLAPGRYLVLARPFVVEAGESAPRPTAWETGTRALLRREAESANTPVELQPCQRTNDFVLRFPPK
ncbi:MAG: carboxypeptidase-like regulatory domain-containing protein [Pyrinomonadaceae bacterium]